MFISTWDHVHTFIKHCFVRNDHDVFILAWYLSKYFKKTRTSVLIFHSSCTQTHQVLLYGVIRIYCFIITHVCTQVHVEARGQLPVLSLSCDPPYFYNGVLHWDLGSPMRLGKSQESPSSYFPSAGIVSMSAWWSLLFTTVGAGKSNSDPHACVAGTVPTHWAAQSCGPLLAPSHSTKHAVFVSISNLEIFELLALSRWSEAVLPWLNLTEDVIKLLCPFPTPHREDAQETGSFQSVPSAELYNLEAFWVVLLNNTALKLRL